MTEVGRWKRAARAILVIAAAWCACGAPGVNAAAVTVHVKPGGDDDAGAGTADEPFATLRRARDAVRAIKGERGKDEPITVVVHGVHVLREPLELGPEDSGTPAHPVVWAAADGEDVRLTGGPALSADAFAAVTDHAVLDRLRAAARGAVRVLELGPPGELNLGEYADSFRGAPAAPELFFNDRRMSVARWPNQGWVTIANFVETGSIPRDGDNAGRPGVFEYAGDDPARWDVDAGVWLQGYWCYDWYDQTLRVKSIDAKTRRITLAAPALYGVRQGNPSPRRFRAINVLAELDEPGEFYIDRTARRLYFWPPGTLDDARLTLSTLDAPLLRATDARHVVVRGITFEATLGNGVEVSGGRDVRIERCTVRNVRQLGIRVAGGAAHRVDGCDITETGTGGLVLEGGDRKTLTPAGHEATNNRIWNFSRHQFTAAYGITFGGVGNRAAHNLIHDAPHQAIYLGGNDHVFEYNMVRDVVTETDDAGALYKGRNPSCRGNVIRYNLWSDIGSPRGHGTGAIYFDDGDGGDLVFGNVFVRCGHPGAGPFGTVFSHGGHDLRAENNIFIDCKRALGSAPWGDDLWKQAVDGGFGCEWTPKLTREVDITKPPYTTRYPELADFFKPEPASERISRAKNNVLVRTGEVSGGNWACDAATTWATDADPGFVDMAGGNYALRPDAEVFKRLPEFKPIPFERIGPQGERGRGR